MKKCTTYTIGKTTIKKTPDYDPDTSYLGEYRQDLKPGCIVRIDKTFYEDIPDEWNTSEIKEAHLIRGEYPYFHPPDNGEKPGTEEYKKYALQDYQLMEDLINQQWSFVGITVTTKINTDMGISDEIVNSLWGIEDHWDKDSRDYHNELIDDLKSENKAELLKMGFTEKEIDESLNNAEEVD